jgi:glycerophosphoryl diester phosphodiesterase
VCDVPGLIRVAHKGLWIASTAEAPEVDMIEFDVLAEDREDPAGSRLVLAHDHGEDLRGAPTLEEGIAALAGSDTDLMVDLKLPGYELRVLEALRAAGLLERSIVSTLFMRSLVALRAADPSVTLSWSVPRVRRDYTTSPLLKLPAFALLQRLKRQLPGAVTRHLRAGRIDALTSHWRLVTPVLVDAVHAEGAKLYVWTVDELELILRLTELGVDGVISNRPELFATQEMRQVAAL